jgi:hypothetical protein
MPVPETDTTGPQSNSSTDPLVVSSRDLYAGRDAGDRCLMGYRPQRDSNPRFGLESEKEADPPDE